MSSPPPVGPDGENSQPQLRGLEEVFTEGPAPVSESNPVEHRNGSPAGGDGSADTSEAGSRAIVRTGLTLAVKVEIQGKWEINESSVRVSDEGEIRLPLIGIVKAEGMTLSALRDRLMELYSEYFVNPSLNIEFSGDLRQGGVSPWGSVTVLGRVKTPGVVPMPPTRSLSVIAAIAGAGGFDLSADQRAIRITSPGGASRDVNLSALGRRGQGAEDFELKDGDIVYVPERIF